MQQPTSTLFLARDVFQRSHFIMGDVLRRAQGAVLEAFGLGPEERAYRIVAKGPYWRLRDYCGHSGSPELLIVAAPIKRPYIWDLAPRASAICHCLNAGLHVYLLEWIPDSRPGQNNGLDEYAEAIGNSIEKIASRAGGQKPFLIGHSLGGTLAAISAALAPARIQGLVLLETPLCFAPGSSRFRDSLVSLIPTELSDAAAFPGSLLSYMATMASPDIFLWSRLRDAFLSAPDSRALEIQARVERWTLDELPLPGKLVRQILEYLYRENRFCRGCLTVRAKQVGPADLSVPTLAVVNTSDDVAPLASLKPCIDAMPVKDVRIMEYPGETGVGLQHIGALIGPVAHEVLWPDILAWIQEHCPAPPTAAFDQDQRPLA